MRGTVPREYVRTQQQQALPLEQQLRKRARHPRSPPLVAAEPLAAAAPLMAAKGVALALRGGGGARDGRVERVAQEERRLQPVALHVFQKVVDVAGKDADEVRHGAAAHEHADGAEHPRKVEGLWW